jgi:hypothetical protein
MISIITDNECKHILKKAIPHLEELKKIIFNSRELLEGDCMYIHNSPCVKESSKNLTRKNLMTFAKGADTLFEVGFNAGHSDLFMLLTNPNLHIDALDICEHKYTKPCFEYLKTQFPGRITLTEKDSTHMKEFLDTKPPYDIYHIDGCHITHIADSDFRLCHQHSKNNSILIFDDYLFPNLNKLWNTYTKEEIIHSFDLQQSNHSFGLVQK